MLLGVGVESAKDLGIAGVFVLLVLKEVLPPIVAMAKSRGQPGNGNGKDAELVQARIRATVQDEKDRDVLYGIAETQRKLADQQARVVELMETIAGATAPPGCPLNLQDCPRDGGNHKHGGA